MQILIKASFEKQTANSVWTRKLNWFFFCKGLIKLENLNMLLKNQHKANP